MVKRDWKLEVLLPGNWRGATSVLLSNGNRRIVVDTGMPHESHQLIAALAARDLRPSDIQFVVNTHFHLDHVLNNNLFPKSLIYGSQECYEWCRSVYSALKDEQNWEKLAVSFYPETLQYSRARKLMATLRKLTLRWWDARRLGDPSQFRWLEAEPLPDNLECLITSGHVPGHASLIVHGGQQPAVIAGDALLTREQDTQVVTMIPRNRAQFLLDRARILSFGGRIVPGHDQEFLNRSQGREVTPKQTSCSSPPQAAQDVRALRTKG